MKPDGLPFNGFTVKDCVYLKEFEHASLEELKEKSDLVMIKVGG